MKDSSFNSSDKDTSIIIHKDMNNIF